jgi:hypothetical protein
LNKDDWRFGWVVDGCADRGGLPHVRRTAPLMSKHRMGEMSSLTVTSMSLFPLREKHASRSRGSRNTPLRASHQIGPTLPVPSDAEGRARFSAGITLSMVPDPYWRIAQSNGYASKQMSYNALPAFKADGSGQKMINAVDPERARSLAQRRMRERKKVIGMEVGRVCPKRVRMAHQNNRVPSSMSTGPSPLYCRSCRPVASRQTDRVLPTPLNRGQQGTKTLIAPSILLKNCWRHPSNVQYRPPFRLFPLSIATLAVPVPSVVKCTAEVTAGDRPARWRILSLSRQERVLFFFWPRCRTQPRIASPKDR